MCVGRKLPWLLALAACSSSGEALDGTDIAVDFDALSGGIVFATAALPGAQGYELYHIPTPSPGQRVAATRLTNAQGNAWQPSVARGGTALAFVFERAIHVVGSSGRIRKVTNPASNEADSIPSLSFDGDRVAWVREFFDEEISNTAFVRTAVMVADIDGQNAVEVLPKDNVIQDAPVFEPVAGADRLAWSEFNAMTFGQAGPVDFGLWVHDFSNATGAFACRASAGVSPQPEDGMRDVPYRCFGLHLAWPRSDTLLVSQELLEVGVDAPRLNTFWPRTVAAVQGNQAGFAVLDLPGDGFFSPFPISASYSSDLSRIVFDGLIVSISGNVPTKAFYLASPDGTGVAAVQIEGYAQDDDRVNTGQHRLSLATPQLMP